MAESLAGCCYKASPCGSVIKGGEIFLNVGKPVIGLKDCFVLFLFFFLLQPRCLKYCYPQYHALKPKERNSAGSSCGYRS